MLTAIVRDVSWQWPLSVPALRGMHALYLHWLELHENTLWNNVENEQLNFMLTLILNLTMLDMSPALVCSRSRAAGHPARREYTTHDYHRQISKN